MKIYLDKEYRCHVQPGEGLTEVEVRRLNGKCPAYIEGCRYVPAGESWTREDGEVFEGVMLAPWKDYEELAKAQAAWELEQLIAENERLKAEKAAMEEAYAEGVASA